ncbi:MAG: DUF4332 domain-containing protein [Nostocaceae cyanobacterium]|nr:DUF4332 domain-containing protein [Nostocaceae cyanobacterium]
MKVYKLGELFALPLQSGIRAQNLALQETISLIEQIGLEEGEEKAIKTFRFKAERTIETREIDATGEPRTQFNVEPFEVSIPLLAMISLPSMQLQEMNVEFGVEVVEPKTEPIKSNTIPSAVLGSSLATSLSRFTTLVESNSTTMKVNMKIVREVPEGMARVGDILTDLISGQPLEKPKPEEPPTTGIPIEQIPGLDAENAEKLKKSGIETVQAFISATETEEGIQRLAKILGVEELLVRQLRERALTILSTET